MPNRVHLRQLDALRGLAALGVVGYHFRDLLQNGHHGRWLEPLRFGSWGVTLFFVLSGFVIHYGFLTSGQPLDYGRFLWRRFWRIYPAYLVSLAVLVAVGFNRHTSWGKAVADVVAHLLMLHNFNRSTFFSINAVFWSLAVEWQFYLAFPLLLWLRRRWGMAGAAGLSIAIAAPFLLDYSVARPDNVALLYFPLGLWFQWCVGAWAAERFVTGRPPLISDVAAAFVIAAAAANEIRPIYGIGLLAWTVILLWLVEFAARSQLPRGAGWLVWCGTISYSLYIWHQPAMRLSLRAMPSHEVLALCLAIGAAVVVSAASFYWVELPGQQVGRLMGSKRRMAIEESAAP
jgi:peptidoglycan/LPS O-acetylase OafA/YrhL